MMFRQYAAEHGLNVIDEYIEDLSRLGRNYILTGQYTESYSWFMRLLPPSYRMFQLPAVLYDSMIFVTNANPTKILPQM